MATMSPRGGQVEEMNKMFTEMCRGPTSLPRPDYSSGDMDRLDHSPNKLSCSDRKSVEYIHKDEVCKKKLADFNEKVTKGDPVGKPKEIDNCEQAVCTASDFKHQRMMKRSTLHDGHGGDEGHQAKKQVRISKLVQRPSESKTAAWDKIMNLIIAVDDVLEKGGLEDVSKLMNQATFNQCEELRKILAAQFKGGSSNFERPSQAPPFDSSNIPISLSALSITPWSSSEIPSELPQLPVVMDAVLDQAAFTHQGMGGGRINDLNYERLEWVGDSYLYLTATLLISQTFPSLLPGKCSQLRERCIKNLTLAEYARQYNFVNIAKIPHEMIGGKHATKNQDLTKILGDIFEAYVAAVILSDPPNGLARATDWLKKLWSMTLRKEIINEEKNGVKYDSPMWRLRGNEGFVPIPDAERVQLGPKEQLQKLLGSKGIKLTYRDAAPEKKDKTNKLPLFTIGVYLDGYGEIDRQLGYGTANGKKDAGIKAATMALTNKNLMKWLLEKKQVRDAQIEQERLALERVQRL